MRIKKGLRSGMLFDVRSGKVLWDRNPGREVPIASLTKMMTALVVVAHSRPGERVLITRAATHFTGSGVGLLPLHKRVPLEPLLYGLLLPSGNDAAIALAQHVAGNQARFIGMMNARATAMGLRCTHFTLGLGDHRPGQPLVRAGSRRARTRGGDAAPARPDRRHPRRDPPLPDQGRQALPLQQQPAAADRAIRGADGVKTGYTVAAGPCLVATARRGRSGSGSCCCTPTIRPTRRGSCSTPGLPGAEPDRASGTRS